MIVSDARREANRRNALKSSGPKTADGKAQAALNALKHGFTAQRAAIGPEAEQALAERVALWRGQYQPGEGWQSWLVEELAGVTLRLGRIAQVETQLRAVAAWRAEGDLWDEDRRLEAERIGAGLERQPAKVVALLRRTPHGCDWLIERWAALARLADTNGGREWDAEQTRLARDLLGTPATSRVGPVGIPIDEDGRVAGYPPMPAVLARREIAQLQILRTVVSAADDLARTLVATGCDDVPSRDIATLRRYERATHRRMYWLMDQMHAAGLTTPSRLVQPPHLAAAPTPPVHPTPEAEQPLVPADLEADPRPIERNEPIAVAQSDETNPLLDPPVADRSAPSSEVVLAAPATPGHKRPDLHRLARREEQDRRNQKRHRRSA